MFWHDWTDPEIRHVDEVYIAVTLLLTLAMIIGWVLIW